jgi:hypothetical protein
MVGMNVGGSYTLNLESPGCYYVGTVIHELMSVSSFFEKKKKQEKKTKQTIHI